MSDTKEIISCPACQTDMKKIYIANVDKNIDFCPNCGGLYFDNREFKKFDEKHEYK